MASASTHNLLTQQSRSSSNSELKPSLDSFATALVLLPPPSIQSRINLLRSANDKSFPRWTAHVTLVYPFVQPDLLDPTLVLLRNAIKRENLSPFKIKLDHVGRFRQREYETFYLGASATNNQANPARNEDVRRLWAVLAETLEYRGRDFIPHMTLGQAPHKREDIDLLRSKGQRLLDLGPIEWLVNSVVVLRKDDQDGGNMKIVDELFLDNSISPLRCTIIDSTITAYHFSVLEKVWLPTPAPPIPNTVFNGISILTFNILHDHQHPSIARFESIKEIILSHDTDIVCLQEVTDQFLQLLLSDDLIRSKWTWSTRGLDSPMESERNILVLSKDCFPFNWKRVVLGGKHKAANVLTLRTRHPISEEPLSVIFAGLHFTAGVTQQAFETKTGEFRSLIKALQQEHADAEWILAGDTNLPASKELPSEFESILTDVWVTTFDRGDANRDSRNATYDPERNILAAQTARSDRSPQRYDRIYTKRSAVLTVQEVVISASGPPASDHWPLFVRFSVSNNLKSEGQRNHLSGTILNLSKDEAPAISPAEEKIGNGDYELRVFAQMHGAIPQAEQRQKRELAINTLCGIIGTSRGDQARKENLQADPAFSPLPQTVQLLLLPVGSFALGVDFPDSDIDCTVVGNVSSPTFWALIKQRITAQSLKQTAPQAVRLRRFVKDAAVQMMILDIEGTKVDLQYCPASKVVERWVETSQVTLEDFNIALPLSAMRVLNAYKDRLRIQTLIPSMDEFRLAFRCIKLFFLSRGIFSSRFGYLGGIHISILLTRVAGSLGTSASAMDLIKGFFSSYAFFKWTEDAVSLLDANSIYRRTAREAMVILSPEKPVVNVAAKASPITVNTVSHEIRKAHYSLEKGVSWPVVCSTFEENIATFRNEYDRYVKVDVNYWGGSSVDARALLGYLESRLVHLLVELHAKAQEYTFRFWPERFTEVRPDLSKTRTSSVTGFYLIGFRQLSSNVASARPLVRPLQNFEDNIRRNESYYDVNSAFVSVTEVLRRDLPAHLYIDKPNWIDGGLDDYVHSSSDDEDIDDDESAEDLFAFKSGASSKKQRKRAKVKIAGPLQRQKLRTSVDVYNRLMWDSQYDKNDYLIGYEDRFKGVKEVPIREWKRDVDDEAFIPFHRVVHFRCKSSGELVWDRRSKIDLLFGSGLEETVKQEDV